MYHISFALSNNRHSPSRPAVLALHRIRDCSGCAAVVARCTSARVHVHGVCVQIRRTLEEADEEIGRGTCMHSKRNLLQCSVRMGLADGATAYTTGCNADGWPTYVSSSSDR